MEIAGFTPFPPDLAREYTDRGYWPDQTLGDVLDRAAARRGDTVALVDERLAANRKKAAA